MKILIVEDNPINAKILAAHLKSADFETVVAASGKEALACLESDYSIMLIISDIMMPEMSGLELLQTIKTRPSWQDLPVIMCSALADLETVKEAVKQGCKGYIVKPVLKHHVLRKVRDALAGNREILKNKQQVMRHLGLNEPDYEDIARDFLAMIESTIPVIEKAVAEKMPIDPSVKISTLRENAVYLSTERLVDVLEEHDATSESKDSFNVKLLNELRRVRGALRSVLSNRKTDH